MIARRAPVAVIALAACLLAACMPPPPAGQGAPAITVNVKDEPAAPLEAEGQGHSVLDGAAQESGNTGAGAAAARTQTVAGQLVVTAAGGAAPDLSGAGLAGATVVGGVPFGSRTTWLIQLPASASLDAAAAALLRQGGVEAVGPNHVLQPFEAPPTDDPLLVSQWSHGSDVADVYGAWPIWDALPDARRTDSTVAIIDWFPERTHPDLNLLVGYWSAPTLQVGQAVSTAFDRAADVDHGLNCAGVVGALKDNTLGAAGVAPGVPILPIRVTDSNGSATDFNILQSLQIAAYFNRADSPYTNLSNAAAGPVRVVNMSLGMSTVGRLATYDAAFEFLRDRGVLVLVAAGNNSGDGRVETPANNPLVTAVSASMQYLGFELLAPYSSRGEEIWVAGPGNMIWATARSNSYKLFNGTSSATPFVAGVAALINAVYGDGGAGQENAVWTARVRQRLAATASDLGAPGFDHGYGYGRVHARRAITGEMP